MIEKHYDYTGYAYVYNNPIMLIDPFGKDTIPSFQLKLSWSEKLQSNINGWINKNLDGGCYKVIGEGSSDPANSGGLTPEQGIPILGATITLETGGLGFLSGLVIKSVQGVITAFSMANALDDLGALTNNEGNSFSMQATSGNIQKSVQIGKFAITTADFITSAIGYKDGKKGIDFISSLSAVNDLSTGILPNVNKTIDNVKSLYYDISQKNDATIVVLPVVKRIKK
jgi:hypothetical protein